LQQLQAPVTALESEAKKAEGMFSKKQQLEEKQGEAAAGANEVAAVADVKVDLEDEEADGDEGFGIALGPEAEGSFSSSAPADADKSVARLAEETRKRLSELVAKANIDNPTADAVAIAASDKGVKAGNVMLPSMKAPARSASGEVSKGGGGLDRARLLAMTQKLVANLEGVASLREELEEANASFSTRKQFLKAVDNAVNWGSNIKKVERLLDPATAGSDFSDTVCDTLNVALSSAAKRGHAKLCSLLIKNGASCLPFLF